MGKNYENDYWIQQKCAVCGKIMYPNVLYAYKIKKHTKTYYACGYTHFREMQKKLERKSRSGKKQEVFELDASNHVIRKFPSQKKLAEHINKPAYYVRNLLQKNEKMIYHDRIFTIKKVRESVS